MPYLSIATRSGPMPKAKPVVDRRVVAHAGQNLGMHHARPQNLYPPCLPAHAASRAVGASLPLAGKAVDGHVHARLNEGEVVAAEADFAFRTKDPAGELIEGCP